MRSICKFRNFLIVISITLSMLSLIPVINSEENITIVIMDDVDVPVLGNGYGFLKVSNITFLGSCDVTLSWDPDVVNVTDVGDSDFDSIDYYVNYSSGVLSIVAFSVDAMNGNFTIANITFERAPGASVGDECELQITNSIFYTADSIPNEILHIGTDGLAKIYDIENLAIVSMDDVDVPVVGNGYGFLIVSNVTFLGSCDVTLSWDPDVVNVTDVGDSDFDIIEYYVNHTAGILNIVAFSYNAMIGDFAIANLTFESVYDVSEGDECDLEITNSMLFTAEPFPSEIDHASIDGKALIFGNSPPYKPKLISPLDGSVIGSTTSAELIVRAIDVDEDQMKIMFFNAFDDSLIDTINNVQNSSEVSVTWMNLISGNTYSWYAVANDSEFETKSDVWSFTTREVDVSIEIDIKGGIGINSHFINIGGDDLTNIKWSTSVKSTGLLGLFNESSDGIIICIDAGEELTVKKILGFGLYSIEISATAEYEETIVATEKVDGFLIGPYVIII